MIEPELWRELPEQVAPAHTALILVDMQHDFCTPGFGADKAGRDLSAARGIIPNLQALLEGARRAGVAVAHVGFWTLPGHGSDSGAWLTQRRRSTASADNLCIAGSEGAGFIPELAPRPDEWIVHKHRYSGFAGTNLDTLCRARNIRTVIVTGVSTNACVESTFRGGFDLGYYVVVPTDGCGSWNRALHDATLENARHRFGQTPTCADILAIWTGAARG